MNMEVDHSDRPDHGKGWSLVGQADQHQERLLVKMGTQMIAMEQEARHHQDSLASRSVHLVAEMQRSEVHRRM